MARSNVGRSATLKDVASRASVSPTTVSRFLSGAISLPDGTASRIRQAASDLDYRPNPIARSLGRGVSDTIGLALPDLSNAFFGQLASSLEEAAKARGRSIMLSSTMNDLGGELRTIERLEQGYFDALLLATNHIDDGRLAAAINRNAGRVVLLDEDVPNTRVPKIFSDNHLGGCLAGQALIAAGHRHIAYVGGPSGVMSAIERGAGFEEGAAGADVTPVSAVDYTAPDGRAATERVLSTRPEVTAIFFGSDTLLMGGLAALRASGRRIGPDVSVISFDDVGPLEFFDPPITAIRHRMGDLGQQALELVLGEADASPSGAAPEPYPEVRVPVDLVARASIAPPATPGRHS